MLVIFSSCASNRKPEDAVTAKEAAKEEAVAQKAEYDGNCPMGLCLRKKVKGNEKYNLDYKGKHYVFSSQEAKDKFITKLDENIKKADLEWESRASVR
jgi:YHS domain-containing protein